MNRIIIYLICLFSTSLLANEVTWLGQSTLLIKTKENKNILIDPFIFDNPKTPAQYKVDAKYINIDLVLITHGHGDHLGSYKKILKLSPNAKISMNADMANVLIASGELEQERYLPLNKSGELNLFKNNLKVSMVRAEHSSTVKIGKTIHPGGEPVGYVLKFSNQKTLYHAGDTGVFGDMKMIGEYYKIDYAFVPIGGNYTMGPKEAAYAVDTLLKPKFVIPFHYGTFPILKGTPKEFKKYLKNKKRFKNLKIGESIKI